MADELGLQEVALIGQAVVGAEVDDVIVRRRLHPLPVSGRCSCRSWPWARCGQRTGVIRPVEGLLVFRLGSKLIAEEPS